MATTQTTRFHGGRRIYGICNVAYYSTRPSGTETWCATRDERDTLIASMRDDARRHGLGCTACEAGIYPITERLADLRREYDGYHVRATESLESEAQ